VFALAVKERRKPLQVEKQKVSVIIVIGNYFGVLRELSVKDAGVSGLIIARGFVQDAITRCFK
jgi:hypothetical protein